MPYEWSAPTGHLWQPLLKRWIYRKRWSRLKACLLFDAVGASTELLKALARKGALCFAATHDLELTTLLEREMDNYHFEEMVEGADITFPYVLRSVRAG